MIFLLMGVALLIITGWALSLREMPGYLLGWLVGIFLIIVIGTLAQPQMPMEDPNFVVTLSFFGIVLPSAFGLALGFGVLLAARVGGGSSSRVARALTVAVLVSFTLVTSYLLLLSAPAFRIMLAIFALTFAIGALFNYILMRGSAYQRFVPDTEPVNTLGLGQPITPVEPTEERVRTFRERVQRARSARF